MDSIIAGTTDIHNEASLRERIADYLQPQVEQVQTLLDAYQREAAELDEKRRALLLHARAELAAEGIDAHVIPAKGRCDAGDGQHPGDEAVLVEAFSEGEWRFGLIPQWRGDRGRPWGPHQYMPGCLQMVHGRYTVLFRDGDEILVAKVSEPEDAHSEESEEAHKRAIGRLRRLAKSEAMRVRMQDRQVQLVSPFNTIVHTGDVLSAFKWLLGIEVGN